MYDVRSKRSIQLVIVYSLWTIMIFKTLLKKGIWDNINKNVYFQAQPQHVHILVTLIYYTALLLTCCRWLDNKLVRFPHNIGNTNTRKVFYYIL